MTNDFYSILGLNENCSDEELENAYRTLKEKYSEDRFLEGEAGNEAARKLTEIETAYREIISERKESEFSSQAGCYSDIEGAIKRGELSEAQKMLDNFNERNAEWHYLQSVVFYKKNWTNESKKQLEIAMQMDPSNQKYKTSYDKLNAKINSANEKNFTDYSGNASPRGEAYEDADRQMGGDGCMEFCCQMAICNILLNCCCNCR